MQTRTFYTLFILVLFLNNGFSQSKTAKTGKRSKIVDHISLSVEDIQIFKQQTRQKVDEFQQHIITIGSKDVTEAKQNLAIKEALKLFYKGAEIETSVLLPDSDTKIFTRPVEIYLTRLKALPYKKVVIDFYDIVYITDFKKGPDGKYYSSATIIQEFTGFSGDNIAYRDITKKEIEIVIDLVDDPFFKEKQWRVFLGNIRATETSNPNE